jgi:hypothetical protein
MCREREERKEEIEEAKEGRWREILEEMDRKVTDGTINAIYQ